MRPCERLCNVLLWLLAFVLCLAAWLSVAWLIHALYHFCAG